MLDKKRLLLATHLIFLTKNEIREFYEWCNLKIPKSQKHYVIPLVIPEKSKLKIDIFKEYKKQNEINIAWWGVASYLHGFDFFF